MTIRNDAIVVDLFGGGIIESRRAGSLAQLALHVEQNYRTPALARKGSEAGLKARLDAAQLARPYTLWDSVGMARRANVRLDDVSASGGVYGVRELEQKLGETMLAVRQPLTAKQLINVDSTIAAGAESYRVERRYGSGRAAVYKGRGTDVPRVAVSKEEESRPVKTIVVGFDLTIFELAAASFAGFGYQASLLSQCRTVIDETLNELYWHGSAGANIYGILSFPWTAKYVSSYDWSDANIEANPDGAIAELNFICQEAGNVSANAFQCDSIALPLQLLNKLRSTARSATSDKTILEYWLAHNGYVTDIANVHGVGELAGAGDGGSDVIYAFRAGAESGALIEPQGFSQLPVQEKDFSLSVDCYARTGGFYARRAGDNMIAYCTR